MGAKKKKKRGEKEAKELKLIILKQLLNTADTSLIINR